jgi:hypothetical protein
MSAIDDELVRLEQKSAEGKSADSRKSELGPIKAKRDQAQAAYGAKRADLYQRWKDQVAEFRVLRKDIVSVYPDWADLIKNKVCPVLDAIKTQRKEQIDSKRGANEAFLVTATENLADRKAKLDAWLTLDQWLGARLKETDSAIKDTQALFGGPNQIRGIYLLWFKVRPALISMAPDGEGKIDDGPDPDCLPALDDHRVYLVDVGGYPAKIDQAWDDYDKSRAAKQAAEDKFKAAPDDLTAELKKLKDMKDRVDKAAEDALQPPN